MKKCSRKPEFEIKTGLSNKGSYLMKAVIQAGGKGTRLAPYTLVLPKPMMPVGDQPVIEILLKWLRRNNIEEVVITTGHLAHIIKSFCANGDQWDMGISYCQEPEPLGTVGALKLIEDQLDGPFLMLNGDLITDLDLLEFKKSHLNSGAPLSIATTNKQVNIDFGVIETENNRVTKFKEKPNFSKKVSMGLYIMNPEILQYIPRGVPYGFDNLMHKLLELEIPINTYHHEGEWMDIGRVEDFKQAQEDWADRHEKTMLGV